MLEMQNIYPCCIVLTEIQGIICNVLSFTEIYKNWTQEITYFFAIRIFILLCSLVTFPIINFLSFFRQIKSRYKV